jgi:hypothetical protein
MKFAAAASAALLTLTLAACSGKNNEDKIVTSPMTAPAQKTVIDTQLKALQKAKDVQKTVDQQKADMDKKVEEGGG